MKRIALLAVFLFIFTSVITSAASAAKLPSGMIVKTESGRHFYVYYPAGHNYETPTLKGINNLEILEYYKKWQKVYDIDDVVAGRDYTFYSWAALSYPCGTILKGGDSSLYIIEPPTNSSTTNYNTEYYDFDPSKPDFSTNVTYYIPSLSITSQSYASTIGSITTRLKNNNYQTVKEVPNLHPNQDQIQYVYPYGFPNCSLIKQNGTSDIYMTFRTRESNGTDIQTKKKIGNTEILSAWQKYSPKTIIEADITSLPQTSFLGLPPGMIIKSNENPNIYFTDDEGKKQLIKSMNMFNEFGFKLEDIQYVGNGTLNSMPTGTDL